MKCTRCSAGLGHTIAAGHEIFTSLTSIDTVVHVEVDKILEMLRRYYCVCMLLFGAMYDAE